jgi:cation:H+ antiporter
MDHSKKLLPLFIAILIAVPGIVLRLSGTVLPAQAAVLTSGCAIFSGAFILLWACDAAQKDVSQALAIAVVALIAVLPEYAVDMYFTWEAGRHPAADYAQFAVANMTGANRLLIGVAWPMVAILFWFKTRRPVPLASERRTEILFLSMATVYAFVVVAKGALEWFDGIVFVGIYAGYLGISSRRPAGAGRATGPAAVVIDLPRRPRRLATSVMFLFAALAIVVDAQPFSEGLIATGRLLHIDRFLLVQWLAPVASEAPEFIIAVMFALRKQAGLALGSLLCAQLNQWTLLVGMIPGGYALAHGGLTPAIPMGSIQMHEIALTAAQSLLAVVMLAGMELTLSQGLLLAALFFGQFLAPVLSRTYPAVIPFHLQGEQVHVLFSLLYLVAAVAMWLNRPKAVASLRDGLRVFPPPLNVRSLGTERRCATGELCPCSLCPNARCIYADEYEQAASAKP